MEVNLFSFLTSAMVHLSIWTIIYPNCSGVLTCLFNPCMTVSLSLSSFCTQWSRLKIYTLYLSRFSCDFKNSFECTRYNLSFSLHLGYRWAYIHNMFQVFYLTYFLYLTEGTTGMQLAMISNWNTKNTKFSCILGNISLLLSIKFEDYTVL